MFRLTYEAFYGDIFLTMKKVEQQLLSLAEQFQQQCPPDHIHPIVYCCSRIKTPESMIRKLVDRGFDPTPQAALTKVFDAVGIRIICAFAEDIYRLAEWIKKQHMLQIVAQKDYYAQPKSNGYRSYHLQIKILEGIGKDLLAEIQIRTIAMDFWATLEHQLKYKKDLPHEQIIRSELKRCADEIASVDLSMQTIRDLLTQPDLPDDTT